MLQAVSCEVCSSKRPGSNGAGMQAGHTSSNADANGDASQEADKGKRKGKTPKFERLRITGSSL